MGILRAVTLRATKFFKLPAKFPDAGVQRADPGIAVGIDLTEPLKLRLRGDQFTGDHSRRIEHGLAFLLDVECVVLTRKLRKLVRGSV